MNNKGFTMIELIMVIMIIALLALLTTPNIIKMINRNKRENYYDTIDSIIEAAELYASDNRYNLQFVDVNNNVTFCKPDDGNEIYSYVTLKELVDSKNLSSAIKNHCTNVEINDDVLKAVEVKMIFDCGKNTFTDFILDEDGLYFNGGC